MVQYVSLAKGGAWTLLRIYALRRNNPIPDGADLGIPRKFFTFIRSELCILLLLGIQTSFEFFNSSLLESTGACAV